MGMGVYAATSVSNTNRKILVSTKGLISSTTQTKNSSSDLERHEWSCRLYSVLVSVHQPHPDHYTICWIHTLALDGHTIGRVWQRQLEIGWNIHQRSPAPCFLTLMTPVVYAYITSAQKHYNKVLGALYQVSFRALYRKRMVKRVVAFAVCSADK